MTWSPLGGTLAPHRAQRDGSRAVSGTLSVAVTIEGVQAAVNEPLPTLVTLRDVREARVGRADMLLLASGPGIVVFPPRVNANRLMVAYKTKTASGGLIVRLKALRVGHMRPAVATAVNGFERAVNLNGVLA